MFDADHFRAVLGQHRHAAFDQAIQFVNHVAVNVIEARDTPDDFVLTLLRQGAEHAGGHVRRQESEEYRL
ncbi:hypothetical protein D3C71_1976410 [compost metagenome]